jgi:hypothetical protein
LPVTELELEEVHNLYLARTYAYVAAGHHGLVIVDIENPEAPFIDQIYDADGKMNDVHDVKLGITNTSEFAYLADGKNGLRVVQLTSADTPGSAGFGPRPHPKLIATYKLRDGEALAVSEALDRDRAVDESGNQISVFGRLGARPLNIEEQRQLYMRNGMLWQVSDNPGDYLEGYRPPEWATTQATPPAEREFIPAPFLEAPSESEVAPEPPSPPEPAPKTDEESTLLDEILRPFDE